MAKRGRKSGFNDKIKDTIVRLVTEGKTEEEIAEVLGVCRSTIHNWKGKHAELMHAVRESRQVADGLVEAAMFQRAVGWKGGAPDTQAGMFWLRNRQPERWREKTEGDVNVNNTTNINGLSDDQLEARIAKLISKTAKPKEEGN